MFGYVVIDKPNILIKDYSTYRSYYCGLCKRIGKNFGQFMRLTVNYDIVLLSLLAHNYEKVEPLFTEGRCVVHPIGKKIPIAKSDKILDNVVDINTILGYYKALDDVLDDGKHRMIKQFIKGKYKKLEKKYPVLCETVNNKYSELRALEKESVSQVDALAGCFGQIMQAVGKEVTKNFDDNLGILCYNLGKWIYYIDAIDDISEDFAKKKFNPFLQENIIPDEEFFNKNEKNFRYLLYSAVDRIIETYDKMDITISEGALSNIIYLGLKSRTEAIIKRRGKKCQETRL